MLYRVFTVASGSARETRGTEGAQIDPLTSNGTHIDADAVGGGSALPAVSVLMPVYNGERYVREAIASIQRQTHQDFEFIIINDGSTDRTAEILDEIAAADPRVRVYHQDNIDQPATLNRGLKLAKHDWVAIIDHDDVCAEDRLEKQLRAIADNPTARVVGTYAHEVDSEGKYIGSVPLGPTSIAEFRRQRANNEWITFVHSSIMLHRPTVLALGGYRAPFGSAADSDLWSRVADEHDVIAVPEHLVYYRVHVNSMSYKRFFEQQFVVRWIRACQDARRAGLPEPTMEEQRAWERGQLGLRRLRILRYDWIMNLLRRRRLARFQRRHMYAMTLFAAAMTLDPARAMRKIVRRVTRSSTPIPPASTPPEWLRSHPNTSVATSQAPILTTRERDAVGAYSMQATATGHEPGGD